MTAAQDDETRGLAEASSWLAAQADRTIETHIGQVFLIGDQAFKLKKAADFGYLDFSTRAKRAWAIDRELTLNRRTALDVYRGISWVTREADGRLALDGVGGRLEAVLRMRRFDPDAVLSNRPAVVEGDFAEALGRQVAAFHAGAQIEPGGSGGLGYVISSNAEHLRALATDLGDEPVETLIAATQARFERDADLLDKRDAASQTRACHGDLHLGNILAENGKAVLFDCIEFNDQLSHIDVLYDLAFLLMDLCHRGQASGAARVFSGYLDEAARSFGDEAYRGLAALPLFLSVRATVRAHVSAHMGQVDEAMAYLAAAMDHLRPTQPSLTAIGGLSGSGKSTLSRRWAPRLDGGPGAVVLRTDEIRKRLWGVSPLERLPPPAYGPGQSERVYARLLEEARVVLAAGRSVVLDGVFLKPQERAAAQAVAAEAGVDFNGLWLDVPQALMRQRIAARAGDASDATVSVLQDQLKLDPGDIAWRRIDGAEQDFAEPAAIG